MLKIQQVIFSPGELLKSDVKVAGTIVLLDRNLCRMDISDEGAKLIVEVGRVSDLGELDIVEGSRVSVLGRVRKQQRRTFLEAERIELLLEE